MLLQLTLGKSNAVVNDSTSKLPTAPFLNNGYTFVPLRFIGEATGLKVLWDINLKTVYIYDPATEGKLYYSSGVLQYEGQLKNGKMNGKGKLYREDGTLWYDAEFLNNEVAGWGTLYFEGISRGRDRTGEVSIGQFKGGRPKGYVVDIDDNSFIQDRLSKGSSTARVNITKWACLSMTEAFRTTCLTDTESFTGTGSSNSRVYSSRMSRTDME
jgi:hypothetical protein